VLAVRVIAAPAVLCIMLLATLTMTGCGGGVEGVYSHTETTDGETVTVSVELKNDNVAIFTLGGGPDGMTLTNTGTYKVEGDKVIISFEGDSETFTLENGNLVGNAFGERVELVKE